MVVICISPAVDWQHVQDVPHVFTAPELHQRNRNGRWTDWQTALGQLKSTESVFIFKHQVVMLS